MHLFVVEDEAGLVVEHADETVGGRLAGLGPQHDRREGLRHAPRLHEDVKVRIRVSEEALRQGLLDIVNLKIDGRILIESLWYWKKKLLSYLNIAVAAGQDGDFAIGSQKMFFSLPGAGVFTRRSYPEVQFNVNVFNCTISVDFDQARIPRALRETGPSVVLRC